VIQQLPRAGAFFRVLLKGICEEGAEAAGDSAARDGDAVSGGYGAHDGAGRGVGVGVGVLPGEGLQGDDA
jgi:hypothetical protein